jgi:hypothetical protein
LEDKFFSFGDKLSGVSIRKTNPNVNYELLPLKTIIDIPIIIPT